MTVLGLFKTVYVEVSAIEGTQKAQEGTHVSMLSPINGNVAHRNTRQRFIMTLLCAVGLTLSFPSSVPVRAAGGSDNYDTENTVYQLCTQSKQLINSNNFSGARDLLIKAAAYDPTSY